LVFDIDEFDDHKPEVKRESHANKMKFNSWTVQPMLYTSSLAEGNWGCFVLSF